MPHYAALWVNAKQQHARLVEAVRDAYLAIGAIEGGDHVVLVGEPVDGWAAITDATLHTVDLGVAEHLAGTLRCRTLAAGMRGSGSQGKGATKVFGAWKAKPPTSAKPGKIRELLAKLGDGGFLFPWQVVSRPGTRLTFTMTKATQRPGPFKTTTPAEMATQTVELQREAIWYTISSHHDERRIEGAHAEARRHLGGLVNEAGWQSAYDSLGDNMFTSPSEITPEACKLLLYISERARPVREAAAGFRTCSSFWESHRLTCALVAAAVANEPARWKQFVALLDATQRRASQEHIWSRCGEALVEFMSPEMQALVVAEFPPPPTIVLPGARSAPCAMAPLSEGLRRSREVVADEELGPIAYVGGDLVVGIDSELVRFREGKRAGAKKLGRGGILTLAPIGSDRLLMDCGKKILEVELPSFTSHQRWSGQGEGVTKIAVSPGGGHVVYASGAYGDPGRIVPIGGKKASGSFSGYAGLTWLDDERVFGVLDANAKLSFWTIDTAGKETCFGGGLRAILGGLAAAGGHGYVASSAGIHRVRFEQAKDMTKPAALDHLWEGRANDIAWSDDRVHAATDAGVLTIDGGGKVTMLSRAPAQKLAIVGTRVAYVSDATVHELL